MRPGRRRVPHAELAQAVALFESFREKKQTKPLAVFKVKTPRVVAIIGYVDGFDYTTAHGKKEIAYRHEFAAGSRPLFCVSADGKQLLLIGGRFEFTDRGIVDHDAQGREIENARHGRAINSRKARPLKFATLPPW